MFPFRRRAVPSATLHHPRPIGLQSDNPAVRTGITSPPFLVGAACRRAANGVAAGTNHDTPAGGRGSKEIGEHQLRSARPRHASASAVPWKATNRIPSSFAAGRRRPGGCVSRNGRGTVLPPRWGREEGKNKGGGGARISPTGCATPKAASLHPRLHSVAPLGRTAALLCESRLNGRSPSCLRPYVPSSLTSSLRYSGTHYI
jgi:hypothetical protein